MNEARLQNCDGKFFGRENYSSSLIARLKLVCLDSLSRSVACIFQIILKTVFQNENFS